MRLMCAALLVGILHSIAARGLAQNYPPAISANIDRDFLTPPDDAKPRVYWFWLFNRVDKAGITRDLEQFKAKGISGVTLICTGGYAGLKPLPGVVYQSPEWWDLFRHAVREAKRVGIELGINLSAGGWTMEGPWVTPDHAMKKAVQASVNVDGPGRFSGKLPQPAIVDGYYHDYCVQAVPRADGAPIDPTAVIDITDKLKPDGQLDWQIPVGKWILLRTGYTLTGEMWSKWHAYPTTPWADTFEGGDGYEIDYLSTAALDDHFSQLGIPLLKAAREAGGKPAYFWSDSWECGKLTWTQDFPEQFKKYRGYDLKPYLVALPGALNYIQYTATFKATAASEKLSFVGTNRSGGDNTVFIDDVHVASGANSVSVLNPGFEDPAIGNEHYQYDPKVTGWSFGGASLNGSGMAANNSGFGNPDAPQGTQAGFLQGKSAMSQQLAGLTAGDTYTISFQAAQRPGNRQTWDVAIDDKVIGSFKPGHGATVVSEDVSDRFRADFDRTIQDCVADNFYGHFTELCHQNGLEMISEAAGPNNIPPEDALKNLGRCDTGSGEFWVNGHYSAGRQNGYNADSRQRLNLKQTATAAHVYGQRQAEAEAFTQQDGDRTHWSLGPADLKPYANDAFCEGINRLMLHQATCQPPSDGKPGYEFCAGQHFNPNLTWWEQSAPFFAYLSRCSYMLQQGNFAADVCFYLGEQPPALVPPKYQVPSLGAGYDCDYCNADVLLNRMSVRDGRIVLPDGISYRLLALQNCVSPIDRIARQVGAYQGLSVSSTPSQAMSVEVVKKLRDLVNDGATIIGAPPTEAAGLRDYPACDEQVRTIAAELWGDLDGQARTQRRFGKGRVIWGLSARQVLQTDGVGPDFSFPSQDLNPGRADYIHRTFKDADLYFITNRTNSQLKDDFVFRVTGRQPEIFDPVTGFSRPAKAFHQAGGCTSVPLQLDRFSSCFVVFRKPVDVNARGAAAINDPVFKTLLDLSTSWDVAFDPQWGGPALVQFPQLASWTTSDQEGIRFYSGKAVYRKSFDLPDTGEKDRTMILDLGAVRDVAEVRLNGESLGILWCAPWQIDITHALKAGPNQLEIDITNEWANRVIRDLNQPSEKRLTKTHDAFRFSMLTKSTKPLDSGLLGPVTISEAQHPLAAPKPD